MAKALLEDNVVIQVSDETFEVHPSLVWVDCPPEVSHYWVYDGTSFTDPNAITAEEQAEIDLEELRAYRNARLGETDYLALSDNTLTSEMASYRQALRDITDTYSNLEEVVWPTKPE